MQEELKNYDKFIEEKNCEPLQKLVVFQVNVICIVQLVGDYARGVVRSVGNGAVEVQLIDNGGLINLTFDK